MKVQASYAGKGIEEYDLKKRNIGFLRQWLNEDRITDVNKMVTNEDIEYWLNLAEVTPLPSKGKEG